MFKKMILLTCFVLVLGLVGSASAMLNYEYYEAPAGTQYQALTNVGFGTTTPTRVGTSDTLNAGDGDWTLQAGGKRADDYAFRFFGYVVVPVSGEITFYLRSDDGSQLRIDGTMVVDNEGLHGTEAFPGDPGKITLAAGAHTIEAIMFERGGGDQLFVNWSYIGQAATGVPDRLLFLQAPADVSPYVVREAYGPNPVSGATEVDIASLEWNAGYGAVSHKVYLSKDATIDATDLIAETPITIQVIAPDPGATYYWRVDEVAADKTEVQGPVWTFATLPREAHFPSPVDGATNFSTGTLSWTAGKGAILHNVYLGTDPAALLPKAMMQLPTSYDPGVLAAGTKYYWRIDEFTSGGTVKGPVWSFSTIGAVAPSGTPDLILEYLFEEGPSSLAALDTSGNNHHGALLGNAKIDGALILDGNGDGVDAGSSPDYHPAGAFSISAFINMTSWGANWSNVIVGTRGENSLGWQLRRHSSNQNLTFTVRGTPGADDPRGTIVPPLNEWVHVGAVFDPAGGTRTVYINGIQDVQITDSGKVAASDHKLYVGARAKNDKSGPEAFFNGSINDLRIHSRALTLHEVRVLAGVEALPYTPDPANGRSGVSTPVALKWNPGDYAVSQDVYFGTDAAAVAAANATDTTGIYRGRQVETTYAAGDLVWGASYYWRADQVAADGSIVAGPLWSFTTADRVVIENFESYDVVPVDPNPAGLVGWWQFDGNLDSVGGKGQTGVPTGTIGFEADPVRGQVLDLPGGNDQYVALGGVGISGNMPRTIAVWAKADNTNIPDWTLVFGFTGNATGAGGNGSHFNIDSLGGPGGVGAHVWGWEETIFTDQQALGWHHYAMSYDGTTIWYYGDGKLMDSDPGKSNVRDLAASADRVHVGKRVTQASSFPGNVDDARIYNYTLSPAEVAAVAGFVSANPLGNTWVGSGTVVAVLAYDSPIDKVMSIQYQNGVAPYMGEASAVPSITDMTKGAGSLLIWVRGDPANGADPIYAVLQDSAGASASVTNPDPLVAQDGNWTSWIIPLGKFAGVNLASVAKLAIGVGNGQPGGAGAIRIDDITLVKPMVITEPADVTLPGDNVRGVPNDGDWPAGERPALVIDNSITTKFLHFKGEVQATGFQVTPSAVQSIVTGLTFTTANDAVERDPIAFELYGSNVGINGPYELIAAGQIVDFNQPTAWPRRTKNTTPIAFVNAVAYDHYQLLFPTVRAAATANSMQIAEVELIGTAGAAAKPKILWVSFHGADDAPSAGAVGNGFTQAPDKGYTDLLKANGYDVTRYVQTGNPDPAVLNAADLVIVGRSVASSSFQNAAATRWNTTITAPMMLLNGYTTRRSRLGFNIGSGLPDTTGDISLTVNDPTHPIFAGIALTGNTMTNPYAGVLKYADGVAARGISIVTDAATAGGTVLATLSAASGSVTAGSMVIGEWPAGATVTHDAGAVADVLAGPRLVFLTGSREASSGKSSETAGMYDLTADGAQMFLNAVAYMVQK